MGSVGCSLTDVQYAIGLDLRACNLFLQDTDDHTVIRKAYRRQAIKW